MLSPTIYAKLYGAGGGIRVYSIGFSFVGIASLINIFASNIFLDKDGPFFLDFSGLLYIYTSFNIVALIILHCVFKEEKVKF